MFVKWKDLALKLDKELKELESSKDYYKNNSDRYLEQMIREQQKASDLKKQCDEMTKKLAEFEREKAESEQNAEGCKKGTWCGACEHGAHVSIRDLAGRVVGKKTVCTYRKCDNFMRKDAAVMSYGGE